MIIKKNKENSYRNGERQLFTRDVLELICEEDDERHPEIIFQDVTRNLVFLMIITMMRMTINLGNK